MAGWQSNIQTIENLCSIKYTTSNIDAILNSEDMYEHKTPYEYICLRRRHDRTWAGHPNRTLVSNEDTEQLYSQFMRLVQKIIDDHYGFDVCQGLGEGKLGRRMIVVPRKRSTKFLDIVEEDLPVDDVLGDVFGPDAPPAPVSAEEEWHDAYEYPG
ncbi:MAG: hypothetical protein Q9168_001901 [Polycauliona sp. 1 TL-2023]